MGKNVKDTQIHLRVKSEEKEQVQQILAECGTNLNAVIDMLFRYIINYKGIPFTVCLPKEELNSSFDEEFNKKLNKESEGGAASVLKREEEFLSYSMEEEFFELSEEEEVFPVEDEADNSHVEVVDDVKETGLPESEEWKSEEWKIEAQNIQNGSLIEKKTDIVDSTEDENGEINEDRVENVEIFSEIVESENEEQENEMDSGMLFYDLFSISEPVTVPKKMVERMEEEQSERILGNTRIIEEETREDSAVELEIEQKGREEQKELEKEMKLLDRFLKRF